MATNNHANHSDDKNTEMNNQILDKGGDVRDGEALDTKAVSTWLRAQGVDI